MPVRISPSLLRVLLLALPLTFAPGSASSEAGSQSPEARATRPSHLRPESFGEQLDHCGALTRDAEPPEILGRCFRHAAEILEQGLRRRAVSPSPASDDFERLLREGGRLVAARLEALPVRDPARLQRELDDLDDSIRALRVELSRIAAAEHVELSLVSRGGVSLGNWQAGFLYVVTEWAKRRPASARGSGVARPAFSTVTGASAGAVNGLAAAVEGCRGPSAGPEQSLYYRVWIDLGLFGRHGRAGLLGGRRGGGNALALFSEASLGEALATAREDMLGTESLAGCRVDFGFVTTHLDRTTSPIHVAEDGDPILTTKKLKEKFAVRLEFSGAAAGGQGEAEGGRQQAVSITNLAPPSTFEGDRIFYADLGHSQQVPLDALLLGVRASAAFPAAFPPVPLTYTQYVPGPGSTVVARRRAATFIDGGVLDNTPVGLAVGLDAWRDSGSPTDDPLERIVPMQPRTYVFVEPEVRSWPAGSEEGPAARARERDLLKVFLGFTGDLLETSTDAQLSNTAEQYAFVRRERSDWTRPRLSVPRRHMPITGEQFYHFMAFLERDFRIFDFYVGMADAWEYLEHEACLYAPDGASCSMPQDLRDLDGQLQSVDPLYRCVRAYYESDAFQVLARIAPEALPRECSTLRPVVCEGEAWQVSEQSVEVFLRSSQIASEPEEDRCIEPALTNHNFRTLLVAMHNYKVWTQSDEYAEELELDRFFDELGGVGRGQRFVYVDLATYQGSHDGFLDAREGKRAFRSLMQDGLDRLASDQQGLSRYALRWVGRVTADLAWERDYPERIAGVGIVLNGVEGVFGQRLGKSRGRWDSTFRAFRIREETYAAGLDPWTTEFYLSSQATWILSPAKFADIEIGAGWALSETIAYNSSSPGHVAFRTGPRGFLALVFVQRLYAGVNVDYYPVMEIAPAYQGAINPVVTEWQWNLTGGWRFLF